MSVFFGKKTDYRGAHNIETNKIECPWCDSIISPNFGYTVGDELGYLRGEIYVCPSGKIMILPTMLSYKNKKIKGVFFNYVKLCNIIQLLGPN